MKPNHPPATAPLLDADALAKLRDRVAKPKPDGGDRDWRGASLAEMCRRIDAECNRIIDGKGRRR